jgi:hypothetical protein
LFTTRFLNALTLKGDMMNILARGTTNTLLNLPAIVIVLAITSQNVLVNLAHAETGKGTDVFRVIMSIFGVDESKGDIVAIVTVNNQEAKVKFFDVTGPSVIPINATEGGGNIIEYVATFPNVTVNSGDEYRACALTVKDLDLKCGTGHNSPASRPEFIDINLDEDIAVGGTEQLEIEEATGNTEEVTGAVTNGDGDEEDD